MDLESAKGHPEVFHFTYSNKRLKNENPKQYQPSFLRLFNPPTHSPGSLVQTSVRPSSHSNKAGIVSFKNRFSGNQASI